jgi:hypothetical protein
MSTTDTMTSLVSAPWLGTDGNPLPVRALPGLRPEVSEGWRQKFSATIPPTYPGARAHAELVDAYAWRNRHKPQSKPVLTGSGP